MLSASTILRTLSRPVRYLSRTSQTRKTASAHPTNCRTEQRRALAQWPAAGSGNDDGLSEWLTAAQRNSAAAWKTAASQQTTPEWKTDMWKRRVESEAKRYFDGEIAGVGRHRG